MKYGGAIKGIRLKKGFTQEELASKLNISQTYLSFIESNKKVPPQNIIELISKVTEIPLYYFMFKALEINKDIKKSKREDYRKFESILGLMIEEFFIGI